MVLVRIVVLEFFEKILNGVVEKLIEEMVLVMILVLKWSDCCWNFFVRLRLEILEGNLGKFLISEVVVS